MDQLFHNYLVSSKTSKCSDSGKPDDLYPVNAYMHGCLSLDPKTKNHGFVKVN